jgi:TatD DNase family protein
MFKCFDTHCHPQFPQYEKDREEVIQRTLSEGVFMVCVGTDLKTSQSGIELAQKYEGIWATVGLHPNDIQEDFDISKYQRIINQSKVVAIGEVGLDYYRTPEPHKQKRQKEIFQLFIQLSQSLNMPMVFHFRDNSKGSIGKVHKDALEILPKDIMGVSHSFTGSIEEAKKYIERGIYLGFNGIITFRSSDNKTNQEYKNLIKYVPLDSILLETDAPYLTPEPYRGKRNESLYVIKVAEKIAEIKRLSLEKVIDVTNQNALNLFKI